MLSSEGRHPEGFRQRLCTPELQSRKPKKSKQTKEMNGRETAAETEALSLCQHPAQITIVQ
jgi:hypothetical protein